MNKTFVIVVLLALILPSAMAASGRAASDGTVPLAPQERQWLARHEGAIRIGITVIPPQVIGGATGHEGLSIDYIHLLERKLGCRFTLVPYGTWNEVIQAAKDRRIDMIFAAQSTPERLAYLLFTEPYIELPNMIVVRKDRKGGRDLKEMKGWSVAASGGSAVHEYLKTWHPQLDLRPVGDELGGLMKVSLGEVDAMVVEISRASYYIEKAGILNLRVSGDAGLMYRLRFAVRNDWPILCGILDKGLLSFTPAEKREINRQWVVVGEKSVFASRRARTALAIAVVGIILAITGVFVWNRTLRRTVRARTSELRQELTERKRAEDTLRETTDFLNALIDALPIPVFYKDADCRYLGFNRTYEEFIGKSREELAGKTVFDIAPPELAEAYHAKDAELLRDRGTQVYEAAVRDMRGIQHEVIFHKAIFTGSDGTARGLIGAILDITERKRTEETLHLQAAELEQEVAERQMAQEHLLDQAVLLEEEIEKRLKIQQDLEWLNNELEQRVQERTAELSQRNTEVQQAYDDLKRIQAQLLQQEKMASIGQLAAGVAHEINNPMGFIISNLGSLIRYIAKVTAYLDANEEHFGSEPAAREFLAEQRKKFKIDRIRGDLPELINDSLEGAERVRRIVQDLKSFSRVDSAEFAAADLNAAMECTLAVVWNELKYKTTVTRDYGELPTVWCNVGQFNQVIMNLLLNASHSIEKAGEILVRTRAEGEAVRIVVSDTGCGMTPETLGRIFDPFFTTKEAGKGTGLGLAIVYDIVVKKHHGSIGVTSEVGVGSAFTIVLPVRGTSQEGAAPDISGT